MLCENCGKREANVRYTQNINGERKEMFLCEMCSEKLGIEKSFNMPINFSSFLEDFFDDMETTSFIPSLGIQNILKCKDCGMSFDDFMHTGKFGCSSCYETFESKIDQILKNIHGSNRHLGRIGKIQENEQSILRENDENTGKINQIEKLKENLKQAIKIENYEEAARIRDEIKRLEK